MEIPVCNTCNSSKPNSYVLVCTECASKIKESQTTDTQQRYAEISALVSELEDTIANFGRPYKIVTQLKRAVQKLQQ